VGSSTVGVGPAAARVGAAAPTAERRLVSVLFVDLVGFTPFAEERDAESVRETLDRYFGVARLAVERHGGTIEKFIGDAVMAVWGTPSAHEDDAERAVRAAFELVDEVRSIGEGIEARAGIVTGEAAVNVGAVGQAMVAGDIVNTASRLQSVAPAGTVLVSEATMRAASAAIVFEPAGQQVLKGKSAPVEAYRALRVVAQRGGQNRVEGLEAPFVGRDEELRLLKELLHGTTRDGRTRLVSISGPAGIGKSRLAWELEKYLDGVVETVYWHRGRSPAYGEGITFWALGEMVRRRAGLAETDDEATTRDRIGAAVAEWVPDPDDRRWVEPALLALLGIESPPAGGRDALFAAWRIFFERIAARGTAVLLFEDLHWADSGLLDFIDHLLEWSRNRPILVITLARPELFERRPDWGAGKRPMTAIPLEPLGEGAMRQLLAGLVPGLPEPAIATILGRADGIPLYAVETVRMLVSQGQLEAVDGAFRPTRDLSGLAVPETLRSLIASRLDTLESPDRALLQDGSVLGQRFTVSALEAVSGLPAEGIEPRLRGLVRRELLELVADPRSPERGQYGFVQSLIREVAYGTLARPDRRSRHLAAARYFEALGDDELAGALASHYLAAFDASTPGVEAEAVAVQARLALRGAAARAADLGAHDQAVSYLEQALTVTPEPIERANLVEMAAVSANAAGRHETAQRHARAAVDAYASTDQRDAMARAAALLGRILIDGGDLPGAIEVMEKALADESGEESDGGAILLATLSRAYMRSDLPARAIEMADRALATAERRNLEDVVAEAFINKASSLGNVGRRRESIALHEFAVRIAQKGGWIEMELRGRNNLAVSQIEDEPKRALQTVLSGVELARRVGQRSIFNWQAGTAAIFAYSIGEDWGSALGLLDEVLESTGSANERARGVGLANLFHAARGERLSELIAEAEEAAEGFTEIQLWATIDLDRSEVALVTGGLDEAYRAALRAVDTWTSYFDLVLPVAGRAALWQGDADVAREVLRRFDAFRGGAAWTEANRKWARAGVAALEGRIAEALDEFRAAIDAYRAIDLHWAEARAILDAIKVLPDEPEVRLWADTARSIFERLEAKPYLAMLDDAIVPGAVPPRPLVAEASRDR
jgi:class 3 adenylate cyclase/tetratricopeptide (TPR) repeat protein